MKWALYALFQNKGTVRGRCVVAMFAFLIALAGVIEAAAAGGRDAPRGVVVAPESSHEPAAAPVAAGGQARPGGVFFAGEPIALPVETSGDHVAWRVTDFWGRTVAHGETNVTGNHGLILPDLKGRLGYFQVSLAFQKAGAPLATAQSSLAVLAPFDVATVRNSPFGVMTHFAQGWPIDVMPLIARAGIPNVRDEIYWDHVERKRGEFRFPEAFDLYMSRLKVSHITPLIPLTFANANWDGGQTPYTPEGFAAYARYCRQVLAHYGDQIKTVEIWNEYNGSFVSGPAANDRAGSYVRMLRAAYQAIKQARPDVTVLGCSTAGVPMPYLEKIFRAGGLKYMDAISIHPYRYDEAPEGIEKQIARLDALARQYNGGKPKPIWVTEVGWYVKKSVAAGEMPITEADQAKFFTRSYALLLSAGVVKSYWYLFRDYGDFATMGLVRAPDDPQGRYAPKPGYVAMATMTRQLNGARFIRTERTLEGLYSLVFEHPGGETVRVMWSIPARTTSVTTSVPLAVVDMMGEETRILPVGGKAALHLTDAPIYVRGLVAGLPPPDLSSASTIVANSEADFSDVQGRGHWYYGSFESGAVPGDYDASAFKLFPDFVVTDWVRKWSGAPQYMRVTDTDQHPGVANGHQLWAVRRWVSDLTGVVRITGKFARISTQGDGTGARIYVAGKPVFVRLLGGGQSVTATFDVAATVHPGTAIDFCVDPGPSTSLDYDGTAVAITIRREPAR